MKLPLILASALTVLPAVSPALHSTYVVPAASPIAAARADATTAADLDGVYNCEGMRPDGAVYRGLVHIVHHNGTYELLWTFSSTEQHVGFGIMTGDVLSVSYFGGELGIVAYKVEQSEKGPRLVGQWTVPEADGQVFAETLTRLTADAVLPGAPPNTDKPGRPAPPDLDQDQPNVPRQPSTNEPRRERLPAPKNLRAA